MAPPPDGDIVSIKQRAAIAARLRSAIAQSFVHWEVVPDLDVGAAFDAYLDEALAAETRLGFVLANQRLMAQLCNGHSGCHDDWVMQRAAVLRRARRRVSRLGLGPNARASR